jgi:hypothetical protein
MGTTLGSSWRCEAGHGGAGRARGGAGHGGDERGHGGEPVAAMAHGGFGSVVASGSAAPWRADFLARSHPVASFAQLGAAGGGRPR